MDLTLLITGSSGYLGSALCVELAKQYRVVGIDRRPPPAALRRAVPGGQWHVLDIADKSGLNEVFKKNIALNQPIDMILHFAAYYHYGRHWRREYHLTNIEGTRNIMAVACCWGARRVIFASSLGSLIPSRTGVCLTERSRKMVDFPYNKSKAMGEAIVTASNRRTAALVLRIGGVFSDWCELPPLYSLMRLWNRRGPAGRCMPGEGRSGFPYIHRAELVRLIAKVVELEDELEPVDILFGASDGCTDHRALFPIIRRCSRWRCLKGPIHVPPGALALPMNLIYLWNRLHGKETYERSWMLSYVDRPLIIDASYTRSKLGWKPDPNLSILSRLPVLMDHFRQSPRDWELLNIRRNQARYEFHPDDCET